MTNDQDGARSRRDAIAVLLFSRADHGLLPGAVIDAANAFARAGGELSSGAAGAYAPSGQSLSSWIDDQRDTSAHWFLPAAPAPVPVTKAAKVKVSKTATATEKLAAANGDAPAKL